MGNCVSLCVSFRQGAGLERVWAAREEWCHPSLDLRPRNTCVADCMPARSFRLGGLSQANRVMASKPTVSNRVIRSSVSVTSPSAIWRVTSRAGFNFPRATSGRLVVVEVRIEAAAKRVDRDVDASPGRVPDGLRDLLR